MRPGPGLVVMALAFISGARRGSTSTSSKTTSLSPTFTSSFYTSSSSPTPSSLSSSSSSYTSSLSSNSRVSSTLSSVFAAGGVPTPIAFTASSSDHNYNYNYRTKQPESEHLRPQYDPLPAGRESLAQTGASSRTTRETGSTARNTEISAPVEGGDDNYNDDNSRSSDSFDLGPGEGLPVRFPSHSADSSTSFDADDILALVSEDDLLSQESLDRLTKLTHDKIGYINEEDYGREFGEVGGDEDSTSDAGPQELQPSDGVRENGVVAALGAAGGGAEEQSFGTVDGYVANLVSSNGAILVDSAANSATNSAQQDLEDAATLDFKQLGLDSPVFDSTSALTRINPWLSACDLAQPGTAPDLQGQCTAGTLPVAWVDEGPGPPTCPKSCEQLRLENNKNTLNSNSNNNKNTNDNKYLIDKNSINIKLNQLVNNNNMNMNMNMNTMNHEMLMLRVRRGVTEADNNNNNNGDIKKTASTETQTATAEASTEVEAPQYQQDDANFVAADSVDSVVSVVDGTTTMTGHHRYRGSNANNNNNYNKQQSQNNNNIVKLNPNHVSSSHYDLKYNSNNNNLNQEPSSRSGSNNNYKQFKQQQQQQQDASDKSTQHTQMKQEKIHQEQQQQCLDYLGDNDEASPLHLCQLKDPSALAYKLRSLRLRHCCERNVFSALHTIALNATMSGGAKCVRVLTDIMELDSLATRITCELAEILFRFDCRQVYSLIHQCTDCKEAYRRWVCSTLIPYFAEQNDTIASDARSSSSSSSNNNNNANNSNSNNNNNNYNTNNNSATTTTTTTSNSTNSNKQINNPAENNNKKQFINNNDIESLYKIENNNNLIKSNESIHNNNNNRNNNHNNNHYHNGNNYNQADSNKNNIIQYFNDHLNQRSERSEYSVPRNKRSIAATFHEVIDCYINSNNNSSSSSKRNLDASTKSERVTDRRCLRKTQSNPNEGGHHQLQQQQHGEHNRIFTATSEDPRAEYPVVSELLKRSKRKVEFRKRRRIRPCLSVCQTVEQKCPYLLPADRAPALPTQYAGEPTFLCLDPNIEETGEQRLKSNNGPPECCYQYCGQATQGLCTYCSKFADTSSDDLHGRPGDAINSTTATARNTTASRPAAPTRHVHNITLGGTSSATQQRKGSVSIALLNVSSFAGVEQAERLPYYAYYAGTFYYDDIDEMPHEPLPACQPVPSVSSRCTIPYYASAAAATAGRTRSSASSSMRALMLCLSALFCLLNSGFAFAAVCRWGERRHCCAYDRAEQRGRKNQRSSSSAARRRRTRSRCCCYSSGSTDAEQDSSAALSHIQRMRCIESKRETCRRREQSSGRTNAVKMKMETCKEFGYKNHKNGDDTDAEVVKRRTRQAATCICSQCRSRCGRISRRISSNISTKLSCNKSSSCSRNHHFFHYFYNFNINDLWRRWWIRGSHATRRPPSS